MKLGFDGQVENPNQPERLGQLTTESWNVAMGMWIQARVNYLYKVSLTGKKSPVRTKQLKNRLNQSFTL